MLNLRTGSEARQAGQGTGQGCLLLLPLPFEKAMLCQTVLEALKHPALRNPALLAGALPGPLLQVLRMLDDPEVARGLAGFRSQATHSDPWAPGRREELRQQRRALFRILRARHPEAMAAVIGAFGAMAGDTFVVVNVYTWLIVFTIGVNGRSEHPFTDWEGPA